MKIKSVSKLNLHGTINERYIRAKNKNIQKNIKYNLKKNHISMLWNKNYSIVNDRSTICHVTIDPSKFSEDLTNILALAQMEAAARSTFKITGPFILLGILMARGSTTGYAMLKTWKVNYLKARIEADKIRSDLTNLFGELPETYSFDDEAHRILDYAERYANFFGLVQIETIHVVMAMFRYKRSNAYRIIETITPNFESLEEIVDNIRPNISLKRDSKGFIYQAQKSELPELDPESEDIIDTFGVDLTEKAEFGEGDPVIGRKKEIDRLIRVLARKSKNNPCLVGDPGVGKTAIAEGLAYRIWNDEVPEFLKNKRIINLELTKIVAGSKYRGDFESRILSIIEMARFEDSVILFIDEIHTIMGAGSSEGTLDAANMLKPPLSRGEISLIGATTEEEFRKYIKADGALERRFQAVKVPEPTISEAIQILHGIKKNFGNYHGVVYSDEAIEACVKFSKQYISDKFLPDKAIDLLDESGAFVKMKEGYAIKNIEDYTFLIKSYRETKKAVVEKDIQKLKATLITEIKALKKVEQVLQKIKLSQEAIKRDINNIRVVKVPDVETVIEEMTGVKIKEVSKSESENLLNLESILHKSVIGQEEAVTAVSKAMRKSRVGLRDPKRPIASFIFAGPTGVGKTELAKTLSRVYFDSEDAMIRFDMSDFAEKHNVSKLIGSPPGYIGYSDGGQLTEAVRKTPHSLVLFDELEKAHPDVYLPLLQVLDDGRLADSKGKIVDFKNTIIILTSNLGAKEVEARRKAIKQSSETEDISEKESFSIYNAAIAEYFRPEFLNRIDEIIIFKRLTQSQVYEIFAIFMNSVKHRAAKLGITIQETERLRQLVTEAGYTPAFGARPLKRTISRLIESPLSEMILSNEVVSGDTVLLDYYNKKVTFIKVDKSILKFD
ncbi:ATP binding subunit of Clp protease (nucleomorph) [Bigelowiella natans]|uniref:ATP binding subunit of Clp protease n=2 Tax=Eukaryota TaxID=2759 RepID=Q3LW37_BIGNA|nr:ATP binding subunit of Clp protease [Bigelowiella natans]ABA27328.1 ATP binding subunit of Clp protease [Bigelowiella natans]